MSDKPKLKAKDAPDLGRFDWQDPFRVEDQLTEEEAVQRLGQFGEGRLVVETALYEADSFGQPVPDLLAERIDPGQSLGVDGNVETL